MTDGDKELLLLAVGDVHPHRDRPETLFERVNNELKKADLKICQLECTLSNKGVLRTDVRNPAHRVPPENVRALTAAGFDVVTFAGNNNLDYGIEAFLDTIERLNAGGISVVGAGKNLEEARKPVIIERAGIRFAFLCHCSILRDGYEARDDRPGLAPLRVKTFYEPLENIYEQPGTPAKTITIPEHDDLQAVLQSIRQARAMADIVVACFHWGVHFTHDLAMYQPEVGYAAIDAGADLVLGTHPHCLQAIDIYRGKAIYYSLGNFAFEQSLELSRRGVGEYLSFYGIHMDLDVPSHPHPRHCRQGMILKCVIRDKKIHRMSFIPTIFGKNGQPEILPQDSEEFREVFELMKGLCGELGVELSVENGEVVVPQAKSRDVDTRELLRRSKISYPSLRRLGGARICT
ncbi:MAG: CapA family protein [Deltaproteobacteria bacterium]|nr:CapA family protein [Deltaproteobacteria bacterium]